jgi:hypothetical protein
VALQFQVVPLSFEGGLDTKTDKKMVIPGKLTTLENGVFTQGKQISKRNGYTKLGEDVVPTGGTIGPSNALANFNPYPGVDELIQVGNNKLYSYSSDQAKWVYKDDIYSVGLESKNIFRNQNDTLNGDSALNSGIEVHAWRDETNARVGVTTVDSATGAGIYVGDGIASIIGRPRVAAVGNFLYLFYVRSTGDLISRRFDVSTPEVLSGETVLAADANLSTPAIDVVSSGGFMWLAYYSTGNTIKLIKLNSAGASVATATIAETISSILTLEVSTNVFVYWYNATDGFCYRAFNSSLVSILTKTVIDSNVAEFNRIATAVATSATSQTVFYSRGPLNTDSLTASQVRTYSAVVSTTGVTTAAAVIARSVRPAAKAFLVSGVAYFWTSHLSTLQSTLFLFRSDGLCIAKAYAGKVRGAGGFSLPSTVARSATEFFHAQAIITKYNAFGGVLDVNSGIVAITTNFDQDYPYQSRMLGSNLHMTGGFLSIYDGLEVTESGFHLYPEDVNFSIASTGGSLNEGIYLYSVIYEWVDNQGQVHKSAPSVVSNLTISTGTSTNKVTLTIPTLRVTAKSDIAIQIYRSEANQTVLYNVKSPTATLLYNNSSVDSVTYEDTASDFAIETNELLYTTGGVLENIATEACSLVDVYQSRMAVAGLEDPNEFAYSKIQVKGEGVAFGDIFKNRLDPLGGPISAIKLMDDKIILFKENVIFYVSGDGPNDSGQQNGYTLPQLITSDSGCPFPKSCVLMPQGVMYKSNKGIYLLNRGLNIQYIGADVEQYNSQDITSAELIQDKNQVRFLTANGLTLVYDYYFQQWSTFTNHQGDDAVIWQGKYTYLRTDGEVYRENTGFLDDTTPIVLKAATAWLKMAGVQGFQRVRRIGFLGEYKSAHSLQVRVGYDYKDAYASTYTFDAATVIASTANPYEFRAHLAIQKCASLRFEFQDIPSISAPGESYNMTDLSLEIGVKRGVNKLKAVQSV